MKVKIGPYRSWIGPYQIADKLCFWAPMVKDVHGFESKPDWVHDFGTWLAENKDGSDTWLTKVCQWIDSKKKRKINIHIDRWDTWSMDHTLALVIVPMLEQLKATKHGSPCVDDSDVPVGLRSTSAPPKENEYDIDDNHFKRYDYILNEMIFAFKLKNMDDWEEECRSGNWDMKTEPCSWDSDGKPKLCKMVEGPNHTYKLDTERYQRILERQENGFRLFGKYFQTLWT